MISRAAPAHEDAPPGASPLDSEQLFRTTFECAAIGIAHVSPQGRWLRVNRRLCELLGYDREELAARTFQDITYPDDLDANLTHARRLLAGEQDVYETDKRYVRKDGAPLWAHLTASLVRTPDGAPSYFITLVQDLAARQRLEPERAPVLAREQDAHAEAEPTHAQLRALQALTDTALSHLALDDLLRELLGRVTGVMGVDHVAILLLDADGRTLTVRAARGPLEAAVGRVQVPVGQAFAGRIAASRAPLIIDDATAFDFDGSPPIMLQKYLRSVVGVPLLLEDQVAAGHLVSRLVGVLTVGSAAPRRFSEADVHLLQHAADRVALAIDRARLYAAEQDARRQAEAALAQAQVSETQAAERAERLNTILETMADGVAVYDAEGRPIQMVNRAYRELYALERGPAEYETMTTLDRARLVQVRDAATGALLAFEDTPVGRALRGEVVTGSGADVRARAFDGRELEINSSAAPLREPDGRVSGAVLVLRDLTERNRLQRERAAARADELAAREVNERMEAFLGIAAHDLRTPLTAVVGFLTLAQHQTARLASAVREVCPALIPSVEAVLDRLDNADQGTERLLRLLTRLFDMVAIRAGRLEIHRGPCDLAALVHEQVAALRVAAPGRSIRMHTPAGGRPVLVEADAERIGQVVTNYLTNALKYAPPDRPVDVSVAVAREVPAQVALAMMGGGAWARVAVRDQGPGLPEVERTRVWEQFHRAPGIAVQRGEPGGAAGGGLGLGLHICKAIVEAHGGRVGVTSAVGQGSTFWFTLPLS